MAWLVEIVSENLLMSALSIGIVLIALVSNLEKSMVLEISSHTSLSLAISSKS